LPSFTITAATTRFMFSCWWFPGKNANGEKFLAC
jgi:uncharacterized protein YodC (DUF2158 family)